MAIHSYLDLSTSHLSKDEAHALDEVSADSLLCGSRVIVHNYGAWVHVPPLDPSDNEDERERAESYPALHRAIVYARGRGALWINFDSDGDIHTDLPHEEW